MAVSNEWIHIPISIHIETKSGESQAISGMYLYNTSTFNYYIISLVSIPGIHQYSFKFTAKSLITSAEINWIPLDLVGDAQINSSVKPNGYHTFLSCLIQNDGFKYKPFIFEELKILVFKLRVNIIDDTKPIFPIQDFSPIAFYDSNHVDIPARVVVQSCPFSLTNVAVFINFEIHGQLTYKMSGATGFLSDIKYLDDMIGGSVKLENKVDSVGLVSGCISKSNGDGDLMTILSWNTIFELLQNPQLEMPNEKCLSTGSSRNLAVDSVVRISVTTHRGESLWGSGVVLSNDCIVTNAHVLSLDKMKRIKILVPSLPEISFTENDIYVSESPIMGYDISFIRLKTPNYFIKPAKINSSLAAQLESLQVGKPVQSIGYGLFFSKEDQPLQPICSSGYINSMVHWDIDKTSKEIGMMIVSASCWNGSSGGGLFNENYELVGIMTSNGKLSSGEILPNFSLIIPINIIEKCLFMLENSIEKVDLSEKISNLWSLKNTHQQNTLEVLTTYKL